jgi:hypothetical protein
LRNTLSSRRLLFTLFGLLLGAIWWIFDPRELSAVAADRIPIVLLFTMTSLVLVACMIHSGHALSRWAGVSVGLASVVGAVAWSVAGELPAAGAPHQGDGQRLVWWMLGSFVFLYVSVPFAQIFQVSGRLRFPYPELFRHSWNNFFIGVVALIFLGLVRALLYVWGALFELVGISTFSEFFETRAFFYLSQFASFGFGLALGRESEAVIATLRRVTLKFAQILLPFVALVATLFAVTLPFTGLAPLWKTGSATPLCLWLLAFFTLFLNGVVEEGEASPSYPSWLRASLRIAILSMPVYAGIALRGTSLRIEQYGLTPDRVFALVFIGIASLYALGYALAAIGRRGPWMGLIRPINVGTALVLAAASILLQLPVLDPMRLSAESQLARLLDGRAKAEEFDFTTLRFQLGHRGWDALEALARAGDHPEHAAISAEVAFVKSAKTRWHAKEEKEKRERRDLPVRFRVAPPDLAVPAGLEERLTLGGWGNASCRTEQDCLLIEADFDRDGRNEYCLLTEGKLTGLSVCHAMADGQLVYVGRVNYRGAVPPPPLASLRETPPTELRPSPYHDLVLPGGEGVLQFVP